MSTGDKLLRLRISKLAVILGLAVISSACMTHSLQTGLSEQDAQEIIRALKSVTGVVDAHVLVVMPDSSPLLDKSERVPPTASVLVKYRGRDVPLAEDEIKKLVARAVEGLQPENVAVVYKKVELKPTEDRSIIPLFGNQEFLLASLGLLGVSSVGCLALVGKGRWQRSKIETLEKQIHAASQRPPAAQLPGTAMPTKAVRTN